MFYDFVFRLLHLAEINSDFRAEICIYIPWRQAKCSIKVLFINIPQPWVCEFSLGVFCCLFYMQHELCHLCFQAKQRNGEHLEFTNQSLGIYTELCQLLFKNLLLFEAVNVAVEYFIDCLLTNQTDQASESQFLQDWHSGMTLHLRYVTSSYWKVHVNIFFSWTNPFGCGSILKYEKNGTLKDVLSTEARFNNCIWFQFHVEELGRPTPRWTSLCSGNVCRILRSQIIEKSTVLISNLFQKVRKTTLIVQNNTRIGLIKVLQLLYPWQKVCNGKVL